MRLRNCFIFSNYLLAALGVSCLALGKVFSLPVSYAIFSLLTVCMILEYRQQIPRAPTTSFSLWQIGLFILPSIYFFFKPPLLDLVAGFLITILITRFIYKTELNDYLYNHLISIVCLLLGALYIQDAAFGPVFLAFYLLLCWSLMFYNMMVERVGSRCPPDEFRATGENETVGTSLFVFSTSIIMASLILTTAIFISFPRLGLGFISLSATGQPISGFSNRVKLGEVGRIKQNESVVMRVEFRRNGEKYRPQSKVLWRGVTLDHYDGNTWSSTLPIVWSNHNRMRGLELFPEKTTKDRVAQSVFMESFHTPVVFTYGLPLNITGSFKHLSMDQGFAFKTEDGNFGPRRFNFISDIGNPETNFTRPVYIDTQKIFPARFLQNPRTSPRMADLAAQFSGNSESPEVIAQKILRHFTKNFGYTLNMERQGGMSAIDEFLFVRKAGHCEYFASAMVLLLRLNGIPARMVNGFMGVEWNDLGNYMIVRQTHAHSWVEAYLPGQGWRVFDPTPPDPAAVDNSAHSLERSLDLMRLYWQRYVMRYSLKDQVELVNFFHQRTQHLTQQLKSVKSLTLEDVAHAIKQNPVWVVVIAWLALAVFALIKYQMLGGRRASKSPFSVKIYQTMLRRLEKKGFRKPPAKTHMEFLNSLMSLPMEERMAAFEITLLYEKGRFGNQPYTPTEKQHLQRLVRQL